MHSRALALAALCSKGGCSTSTPTVVGTVRGGILPQILKVIPGIETLKPTLYYIGTSDPLGHESQDRS